MIFFRCICQLLSSPGKLYQFIPNERFSYKKKNSFLIFKLECKGSATNRFENCLRRHKVHTGGNFLIVFPNTFLVRVFLWV